MAPRLRRIRVAAALLMLVAAWVFVFRAAARMPDFEVYWTAGGRAARAEPLYRAADEPYQFLYFPAFAILAIPLAALPLAAAKPVWFAASLAALVALVRLALAILPERRKPVWLLVGLLIVVLGKYYVEDLVLGQINIWFALAATSAIAASVRGRDGLAGWLGALAVIIKPYGLILLPWLALRGRWRSLRTAAAGLAIAFLMAAPIYGITETLNLHAEWWRTVSGTTARTVMQSDNISLASMYVKWFGDRAVAVYATVATSILLLGAAGAAMRASRDAPRQAGLEGGLLLMLTPLLSPQGWDFVLVVATLAILWVLNDYDRLPAIVRPLTAAALAIIGLTLYDLLGRRLLYALLNGGALTVAVLVVAGALVALRRQHAT